MADENINLRIKNEIISCFIKVHESNFNELICNNPTVEQKMEFSEKLFMKSFSETNGNYDNPTKTDFKNSMLWMANAVPQPEKISKEAEEHRAKTFELVESLAEPNNHFSKSIKKDCFKQNRFVYNFNKPIDEDFIMFLKEFGEVKVFRDFPIPLIKMDVIFNFRLSAIMGTTKIDVFFKEQSPKNFISEFEEKLSNFLETHK